MDKTTLDESPKYKAFIRDRNLALERINLHTQIDLSRIMFEYLDQITGFVSHMAISQDMSVSAMSYLSRQLDEYIEHKFVTLRELTKRRILRMRRATFTLTYLAELEAIARATKRTKPMSISDFKNLLHKQMNQDGMHGKWDKRLWYLFTQLKNQIVHQFRKGVMQELTPREVVNRVKKAYPPIRGYQKPPRALKPIREADKKRPEDEEDGKEFDFYTNLTNDEDWQLAVQSYLDTEIPASRFDNQASFDPQDTVFKYDWELEQEVTDDFVDQVRDGQVEAANDLGVKDFVWVAIIDNKTCDECCLPRNGKTVSEIESMLRSGELSKEECDATSPPAHPYCRCDLAPVANMDEVEGPNWKSFQDWLDS